MIRLIDFHTHVFPDQVAERAVTALRAEYQAEPTGAATVAGLTEAMQEAGVDRAVVLPVATRPEQVSSINRWIATLDRERFIPFGAMHPGFADRGEQLAFLRDQGVRGVKLQPYFQGYRLEEEDTLRMIEDLHDFIILLHAGQEIRPIEDVPTTPALLRELHERFPEQRMVIAHLGGYRMWEEAEPLLVGQNVYLDLSFTFGHLPDEAVLRLIMQHGAERLLFASDYPWDRPKRTLEGLRRLGLPGEIEADILAGNARRLLGL